MNGLDWKLGMYPRHVADVHPKPVYSKLTVNAYQIKVVVHPWSRDLESIVATSESSKVRSSMTQARVFCSTAVFTGSVWLNAWQLSGRKK